MDKQSTNSRDVLAKYLFRVACTLILLATLLGGVSYLDYRAKKQDCSMGCFGKPVLYLYPTKKQEVTVRLDYQGTLTTTYPAYDEGIKGWKVIAHPDGHLINLADKQTYSYLFWEGVPNDPIRNLSTGYVVEGKDTAKFLQKTLKEIGLTPKEYNEFIVFWLPKMEGNNFNLIHFAGTEYTDRAPLTIEPKPDSLLRVFMVFKPLETKIDIAPQKLAPFVRKGFSVIEWGGTEIK